MATMTTAKFNGILRSIKTTGEKLDKLIAQGIEYATAQVLTSGNSDPFKKLEDAVPVFARSVVRDAGQAARKARKEAGNDYPKEKVEQAASAAQVAAVDELAARREKRRAQQAKAPSKAGRQEAPQPGKVEREERYVLGHYNKASKEADDVIELSAEEYQTALAAVQQMRKAAQKPRRTKAA